MQCTRLAFEFPYARKQALRCPPRGLIVLDGQEATAKNKSAARVRQCECPRISCQASEDEAAVWLLAVLQKIRSKEWEQILSANGLAICKYLDLAPEFFLADVVLDHLSGNRKASRVQNGNQMTDWPRRTPFAVQCCSSSTGDTVVADDAQLSFGQSLFSARLGTIISVCSIERPRQRLATKER